MHAFGMGEAAALATALSWAGSCQLHTVACRIIGPVAMTTVRVPLYLTGIGLVVYISGASLAVPPGAFLFLAMSAVLGIALADPVLYAAAVSIGPRLAVLVQSLSACITAVLGYIFFGESIPLMGWLGILTATFGVAFVLMEGGVKISGGAGELSRLQVLRGAGLALLSATFMAVAFLLLKQALALGIQPVWAAFLRFSIGGMCLWLFMFTRGKLFSALREAFTSWRVMRILLAACCISTVGNSLAPLAFKYVEAGIAATLVGLQPIMLVAIVAVIERKMPSLRAVVGTVIAFSGAAMIFLR